MLNTNSLKNVAIIFIFKIIVMISHCTPYTNQIRNNATTPLN